MGDKMNNNDQWNGLHEALRILATIEAKHYCENEDPQYWVLHAIERAEKWVSTCQDCSNYESYSPVKISRSWTGCLQDSQMKKHQATRNFGDGSKEDFETLKPTPKLTKPCDNS